MSGLPAFLVPALIAVVFAGLAVLALRARRAWVRWPGLLLTGLAALLFAALTIFIIRGHAVLNSPALNPLNDLRIVPMPEKLARGQKIATVCAGCHSSTGSLPMDGGTVDMLGGGAFGSIHAPNLTPGGALKDWSDAQILRAIREGIDDQGLPLLIMPAEDYRVMSDEDAQAVIAYIRSQPAVNRAVPERKLSWIVEALIGAGAFPTSAQAPISAPQSAPPAGPTAEYGKYLVNIFACSGCHGADLAGKQPGQGPAGSNLTQLIHPMKQDMFIKKIRTGKNEPDGMPFQIISSATTDDDLTAIYLYLHGLTPLPSK